MTHLRASRLMPVPLLLLLLTACGSGSTPVPAASGSPTSAADPVVITPAPGRLGDAWGDSPAAEGPGNLLDRNPATKYLTFHNHTWITLRAQGRYLLQRYALVSGNDAPGRDPRDWQVEGSMDGTTWTLLDSRKGESFSGRGQSRTFDITAAAPFRWFRLSIQAVAQPDQGLCQLADWTLTGIPSPAPTGGDPEAAFMPSRGFLPPGGTATFTSQGANATTWQWSFPGGTPASSTEAAPQVRYDKPGSYPVTLVAGNPNGSDTLTRRAILTVVASGGDWTGAPTPQVTFVDEAPKQPGSALLKQAVPDVEGLMRAECREILKLIYWSANDGVNAFDQLTLKLVDDPKTVAWKSGDAPDITIGVGAHYLASFHASHGQDPVQLADEIRGVLSHEGTHGYQWSPRDCGAYRQGTDFYGFVEGMADYVRIERGLHPEARRAKGGHWNDGYRTTGFFLQWLQQTKDRDFVRKLNATGRDRAPWSWDEACRLILGQGVQALWDEYQKTF